MSETYGQLWRTVRNHVPHAPVGLVQYWVQNAWNDVQRARSRGWSFLRAESEFVLNAASTGTVDVTRSSATVTGVTLTFAATDVGRQFRVGTNSPLYTVSTVNVGANTCTLDRVYGSTSATATSATVMDAFVTVPLNFRSFICVMDTVNNWQLHLNITEDEINRWDAQRSSTGTPWCVVSRRASTLTSTSGQYLFEVYPYTTSAKNYPYFYYKRAESFTDDADTIPDMIPGNILIDLALAEAAIWPGTADQKNPYFNLTLSQFKRDQAKADLARVEVMDEEIYLTWLETAVNRIPFCPIDSRFLQSHDYSSYDFRSGPLAY